MPSEAQITSVPAPVGGLNVVDSLVNMPPTDAVAIENLVPQPYGCAVRRGYALYASGLGSASVNSVAQWASLGGTNKIFGWCDTSMYDITTEGPTGAAVVTGLTNSWWQTVTLANAAGTHLIAFNGVDDPILYNLSGYQRLIAGDGTTSNTWANVDPSVLIQGTIHQKRLWAVEVNSMNAWYLPANQIYGVAAKFDFGPVFKLGGYLDCLYTWTVDSGDGSDDKLVAVSSNGEAAVYAGTDVATASAWNLVGVYNIGKPVRGRRFGANVSGDLLLVTQAGLVSMAAQVTSTQVNSANAKVLSDKVQFLLNDLVADLGSLDGWDITYYPSINLLYINIPSVYDGGSGQLVLNLVNQAWCTFSGMDAACFANVSSYPYFGGNSGKVYRSWYGTVDNANVDGSGGTNILAYVRQAYSYLGAPAAQKQIGMYRPNILTRVPVAYNTQLDYDFHQAGFSYPSAAPVVGTFDLWNLGLWNTAHWTGQAIPQRLWIQGEGIGVAASLAARFTSSNDFTWVSTDYTYKIGGPL